MTPSLPWFICFWIWGSFLSLSVPTEGAWCRAHYSFQVNSSLPQLILGTTPKSSVGGVDISHSTRHRTGTVSHEPVHKVLAVQKTLELPAMLSLSLNGSSWLPFVALGAPGTPLLSRACPSVHLRDGISYQQRARTLQPDSVVLGKLTSSASLSLPFISEQNESAYLTELWWKLKCT